MMLHNFVIDTGVQMFPLSQNGSIHIEDDDIEPLTNGPDAVIRYNLGYLPVLPQRGQQITTETVTTIAPTRTKEDNTIIRRPNILREIQNQGIQRPSYNIIRNCDLNGNEDVVYEVE